MTTPGEGKLPPGPDARSAAGPGRQRAREGQFMSDGSPEGQEDALAGLDTSVAHSARVWNYLLGGKDHFAADRVTGDLILKMFPDLARLARLQRRFLVRAVRYLAGEAGIRQFLDIGTGLPVANNTHEVAQATAPASRVVYTDNDPMVLIHAKALLTSTPEGATSYVEADVRDPDRILAEAVRTLDLSQPVALVMLGIMGQLPDSDGPHALVRRYLDALPAGSCLALADGTATNAALEQAVAAGNQNQAGSYQLRTREQVAAFFDKLAVVPPGLVPCSWWRPGPEDAREPASQDATACGVGFKH
jgi:S-adenosyl methyltransferase